MHVPTLSNKKKNRHLVHSGCDIKVVDTQKEEAELLRDGQESAEMLLTLNSGSATPAVRSRLLNSPCWGFYCSWAVWSMGQFSLAAGGVGRYPSAPASCVQARLNHSEPSSSSAAFCSKPFPAVSWCAKLLKLAPDCSVYCVWEKWQKAIGTVSPQVNTKVEGLQDIRMENVGSGRSPEALMAVCWIICLCCLDVILSFGSFVSLEVVVWFCFFYLKSKKKGVRSKQSFLPSLLTDKTREK